MYRTKWIKLLKMYMVPFALLLKCMILFLVGFIVYLCTLGLLSSEALQGNSFALLQRIRPRNNRSLSSSLDCMNI